MSVKSERGKTIDILIPNKLILGHTSLTEKKNFFQDLGLRSLTLSKMKTIKTFTYVIIVQGIHETGEGDLRSETRDVRQEM